MNQFERYVTLVLPTMVFQVEQELLAGARDLLAKHGYQLITSVGGYLPGPSQPENSRNWFYTYLPQNNSAGTLFYGGGIGYAAGNDATQHLADQLKQRPLVNIGSSLPGIPSFVADNYSSMRQVVQHLVKARGFTQLGFLTGPSSNDEANERLKAFTDVLEENRINLNEQWLVQGDFTRSHAEQLAKEFVRSSRQLPQVMVCANDLSAHGFMEGLQHEGISVPEQVAVTGFDNFEYAEAVRPALTTASYPARQLGEQAAHALLEQIEKIACIQTNTIVGDLVVRESCGAKRPPQSVPEQVYLEQRRQQVLVRDMHAQRLAFDQSLYQHTELSMLFEQGASSLNAAGIYQLYLCLFRQNNPEHPYLAHQIVDGEVVALAEHQMEIPPGQLLPPHLGEHWLKDDRKGAIWLLHPLALEDKHFGYVLVQVSQRVVEFGEALGIQLSQAINRHQMLYESIERQHELESSLEALKNAHLKLDKAEKVASLGRLVAGIGHELNTPLGAGITMASMLVEETEALTKQLLNAQLSKRNLNQGLNRAHDAASSVLRSLERASSLVDIFKSNSFEQDPGRWQALTIWEVIQSSYFRIKDDLHLPLDLEINCDKSLQVQCDMDALSSVFVHLFYNSAHHAYADQDNGKVQVDVAIKDNRLDIKYQDFGVGIEKEALPRVFEPFYTSQRASGHTGLGLYLVYNLVSLRLRGVITLSSKPGRGTQLQIELPLSAAASPFLPNS
ncbi:substrate-binding domain-containing protein [Corallincola platygyrae]|uniref:histidine kinase n=1 Tax=Corallincola platygyrae TaxID=1193278 RepID=A0ABW4XHW5_9GAMM